MLQINTKPKRKQVNTVMAALGYLLAVVFVFLLFSILSRKDPAAIELNEEAGITDLRDFNFEKETALIILDPDSLSIYPGVFYTDEDFSVGNMDLTGKNQSSLGDYGTIRICLKLPPDEVYAFAAKNVSFSQRLFVAGKEIGTVGEPARTRADMTAANRRYMQGFYVQEEITEIIIHYSGFIHANGGDLYPILLGSVENVARIEQLSILFEGILAAALITAMLFFFGLFLFFSTRRYLLWFALLCGCIAMLFLGINNHALMILLPDVDFTIFLRLAYMGTCWAGLFSALYINGLFPGAANKRAVRGFVIYCMVVTLFLGLAPTLFFTRYPMQLAGSYVVFLSYLLLSVLRAVRQGRLRSAMTKIEGTLLIGGIALYIISAGINTYAHQHEMKFFGWEYQMVGIMIFLFLNLLALTLNFSRTEQERDDARATQLEMEQTNRTLVRLNHIRTSYLGNLTHEIKTPLAGIRAAAQYTKACLQKNGTLDKEAYHGLEEITDRAGHLSEFTGRLLTLSVEQEGKLDFELVDIPSLFRHAVHTMEPLLRKRGNRLETEVSDDLPPACGIPDLLVHVLINLITNADRHCRGNDIYLTAMAMDGMAEIRLSDPGCGIAEDLLPNVFTRGISGDESSGLGLPICKEIVETHGGRIYIDSQLGKGTQVWFTIPFAKEENV